jgi:hypothetical protein
MGLVNVIISSFQPLRLDVSNLQGTIEWYERLFESPPAAVIDEGNYRAAVWFEPMFAIHENQHQLEGDVFDEFRIGLDHIARGSGTDRHLGVTARRADATRPSTRCRCEKTDRSPRSTRQPELPR